VSAVGVHDASGTCAGDDAQRVVVAVDGGGSKTDVVALTLDGHLVSSVRGGGSNPQMLGLEPAIRIIGDLVEQVLSAVVPRRLKRICIYLAGLDLPAEFEAFAGALAAEPWARSEGALPPSAANDLFALLRTGTSEANAVAVVCGTGINALGVRADGATARFPSLGTISGDWGGGAFLGTEALWHAARAEDGRGPKTSLARLVPETFGLPSVAAVAEAVHLGQIAERALASLCPVVFTAARAGDEVAGSIVDRQAEEVVLLVGAAVRRLELLETPIPVVLGGGVLAANDPRLIAGIKAGLARTAPRAVSRVVSANPIVGAGLLALESVGSPPVVLERARRELLGQLREPAMS
jgi:N-acetylglucosamine kinase-like BadF-type ATPase